MVLWVKGYMISLFSHSYSIEPMAAYMWEILSGETPMYRVSVF